MTTTWKSISQSRRFAEIVGLFLLFFALISLLALLSYQGSDASWFHSRASADDVSNWTGRVGANLAEALLQLFGIAALLVPVLLGLLGWNRFRGKGVAASYATLATHGFLLFSLALFLELIYGGVRYGGVPFRAGGFLGWRLAAALESLLNRPGALLLGLALFGAALVLTTRVSLTSLGRWLGAGAAWSWARLRTGVDEWRDRRAERPPRVEEPTRGPRPRIDLEAPAPAPEPRPSPSPPPIGEARPAPPPAPRQTELPIPPSPTGSYALPPLEMLNPVETQDVEDETELLERARLLTDKFREFQVDGTVVAIHPGPVVTTFEFKPEAGVKYSKITGLVDDLCLALRAESVRIDRLPGRATVGIEVPNMQQEMIFPRELIGSPIFETSDSKLTLALGKDINGDVFCADLAKMPHLLIAGATGAGKSVGLNGMIASILYKSTPDDTRFIMIDTKMIELGIYADIPHLLIPVVTDPKKASTALKWAVREMELRYRQLAGVGVRNIQQFNDLLDEEPDRKLIDERTGEERELQKLPFIVIVIDEMADLMMVSSADVEESVMRLAQMARAVGIHLILATQRPSVDVITGTIKANFPSRVAFRVSQRVDSRTIIDRIGAERLLGRGDMLFIPPGSARLMRLHGGFITESELNRITAFLKKQAKPIYDDSVLKEPEEERGGYHEGERDAMFMEAVRLVVQERQCSITLIQRRLRLGYARAARIVDMMEQEGIVGPADGSKPRDVLVDAAAMEALETAG